MLQILVDFIFLEMFQLPLIYFDNNLLNGYFKIKQFPLPENFTHLKGLLNKDVGKTNRIKYFSMNKAMIRKIFLCVLLNGVKLKRIIES